MSTHYIAGVRLGIDPGEARIGVARSDPSGIIATPVATVARDEHSITELLRHASEENAVLIYVGLPRSLSGSEGPAAARVREFAAQLAAAASIPVRLVDERLSTVTAENVLRQQGRKGKKRRDVVDQAAAVVILQAALDAERYRNTLIGELI